MSENITYDWYYDSTENKILSVIKNYDEVVGEFSLIIGKGYPNQLYVDIDEKYQKRMINVFETYFIELYSEKQFEILKTIVKSLLFTLIHFFLCLQRVVLLL